MVMLLQGQGAPAQKEFDTALRIEINLKAVLDKSIAQILNSRKR
jgi:hypothetical protein